MRAVLDTNQFVRALIRTGGVQDRLVRLWRSGTYELAASPPLLAEIEDVIRRPRLVERYGLTDEGIAMFVRVLRRHAVMTPGLLDVVVVDDDPDDNMVLACAVEANADFVVSGDRHLLALGSYEGMPIVRAAAFLRRLESALGSGH